MGLSGKTRVKEVAAVKWYTKHPRRDFPGVPCLKLLLPVYGVWL